MRHKIQLMNPITMKKSTITLSAIIGISLLTLGVLGISHVDARSMAGSDWSQLSPQARQQRVNTWKARHQRRARAMEKLLSYLELDETGLKELHETGTSLLEYIEENGYDLDTVKALFREGMVAQLDELREDESWSDYEYEVRIDAVDERIERALNRVGRGEPGHWTD